MGRPNGIGAWRGMDDGELNAAADLQVCIGSNGGADLKVCSYVGRADPGFPLSEIGEGVRGEVYRPAINGT